MSEAKASPSTFDLSGGHPALDFVNSLDKRFEADGPVELLGSYGDLLRFTQQTRVLEARQVRLLAKSTQPGTAVPALRSARELREALAAVFYGSLDGRPPSPADLRTLERHFGSACRHRELRWQQSAVSSGEQPQVRWEWGRYETEAELPVWALALSASQLMMSGAMPQVRACGAETCRWLFLDTSKNHTRRWCNMKICGNRMKARRFQARHA